MGEDGPEEMDLKYSDDSVTLLRAGEVTECHRGFLCAWAPPLATRAKVTPASAPIGNVNDCFSGAGMSLSPRKHSRLQ